MRSSARERRAAGRRRLAVAGGALLALIVVLVVVLSSSGGGSGPPPLPLPGIGQPAKPGDPFAYVSGRESDFVSRAIEGSDHVLYVKSPGGALATAARVARVRPLIDQALAGTSLDPGMVEALVFVESAGRPDVIVGGDPANASGLTQILASTASSLLGMHIDLARSRKLTGRIFLASARGQTGLAARLERARAKLDDRFDPAKALAGTVRYLEIAERHLGRTDLAFESYHMGIGNLQRVLDLYDGGHAVPYPQLYFDTAPDHNRAAFALISSFGDDSSLYYWRLLGAQRIMRLYRTDRPRLERLIALQTASDSNAQVLHPPDGLHPFADPDALDRAYASRTVLPLPSNPARLGLRYDPGIGALASRLHFTPAVYRGLRPAALDLLIALAARVRELSKLPRSTLTVTSAVSDQRYQGLLGVSDPPAAAGWSFTIARRYASRAQADAFQAMLDRLQALNLIAWERFPSEIEITVAADASQALVHGP
ncbi:MAG TPA: lytic transglycosylase domain-containing protein [Solirubrobacteraceae bacterium]|nr:lytic transglycosylase domain-containing protein [Solirubrobacteraceae bacterium]